MGDQKRMQPVAVTQDLQQCTEQLKRCSQLIRELRNDLKAKKQQAQSELQALIDQRDELPVGIEEGLLLQTHEHLCMEVHTFIRHFKENHAVQTDPEFERLKVDLVTRDFPIVEIIHQDSFFYALHRCLWCTMSVLCAPAHSELGVYLNFALPQAFSFIDPKIPNLNRDTASVRIFLESLVELPTKIANYDGKEADEKKALIDFSNKLNALIKKVLNQELLPDLLEKKIDTYIDNLKSSSTLQNAWGKSDEATKRVLKHPFDSNVGWKELENIPPKQRYMRRPELEACSEAHLYILTLPLTPASFYFLESNICAISDEKTKNRYAQRLHDIREKFRQESSAKHKARRALLLSQLDALYAKVSEVNSSFDDPVAMARSFIENSEVNPKFKAAFESGLTKHCRKAWGVWKERRDLLSSYFFDRKIEEKRAQVDQATVELRSHP